MVQIERFGKKIVGAALQCIDSLLHSAKCGDHQKCRRHRQLTAVVEQTQPGLPRQAHIADNQVRRPAGHPIRSGLGIAGLRHGKAILLQLFANQSAQAIVVLDNENQSGIRHRQCPPSVAITGKSGHRRYQCGRPRSHRRDPGPPHALLPDRARFPGPPVSS